MLRCGFTLLGLLGLLNINVSSAQEKDKGPAYPAVGSLIPDPLVDVLNVTGERKGRYHCLIVRNGLHPVAAVYAKLRGENDAIADGLKKLERDQPLAKLFQKLDAIVDEHIDTFAAAFAVFQVEEDKKKAEEFQTARKLLELEREFGLKRIVFGVSEVQQPHHKPADAELVVILYHSHKVVAAFGFTKDKPLTDKDIDAIGSAFTAMIPKLPKRVIKARD